jgi:hypothetical protein
MLLRVVCRQLGAVFGLRTVSTSDHVVERQLMMNEEMEDMDCNVLAHCVARGICWSRDRSHLCNKARILQRY